MRIAIWHNLPSGGGKRSLYNHVAGLLKRGHSIEAWCPPTADQSYFPLRDLVTERVVPLRWQPIVNRIPLVEGLGEYWSNQSLVKAMDEHCQVCAKQINQGKFDVLFANTCRLFGMTFIGRYADIPKVMYLQEPFRKLYEAMPELPWVAIPALRSLRQLPWHVKLYLGDMLRTRHNRIQAREELLNARAFDQVLVNSFFSRESTLRAYGVDASVCYLGVDTGIFHEQHKPRQDFVVGMGAFAPAKNIPLAIEALANSTFLPRPSLVWVGNYAPPGYLQELRQLAQSRGVDFEARVRTSNADEELVDLLNRAALMVYAPRLEPFGLVPLEANACGLPVVSVAEGGVRETIVDGVNGLLVESNPKSIAAGIDRLRSNPGYACALGKNGRRLVMEKWSWENSITQLERHLTDAAATFRRGSVQHDKKTRS